MWDMVFTLSFSKELDNSQGGVVAEDPQVDEKEVSAPINRWGLLTPKEQFIISHWKPEVEPPISQFGQQNQMQKLRILNLCVRETE